MASLCTTLRMPEPGRKAAPMQIALMSTYEVLAQLLENISSPAYRIRHAQVAILSGRNQARRGLLRHHSRDFMSVLSLSYIWRLTSRPSAQRQHAKVNGHDRSSWPLAGSTCVAISGYWNRTLLRARTGFRPFPGTKLIGVAPTLAAMFFRLWRCRLAPVRWRRAMLTPSASHPWPLRVLFRGAARQNRRRDRQVPATAHR